METGSGISKSQAGADDIVDLAVYDFDGTLLAGKSPVILTRTLFRQHLLSPGNVVLISLWGIAYKMHLPPNEAWVRGRVFRAFDRVDKSVVDAYLATFYDGMISHRLRRSVLERIERDRGRGCVVMTVSATFEPIVERMVEVGVVDCQVSTRMTVDEHGRYIPRVEGVPVEGEEKLAALKRFADAEYGVGKWRIRAAYSDHYSDRPLLAAAQEAVAVHPDRGLRSTARKRGWEILED